MTEEKIIEGLTLSQGQSQTDRSSNELKDGFIGIDERSPEQLLLQAKRLAELIRFYPPIGAASGDWAPFFASVDESSVKAILSGTKGELAPHLALLVAFFQLYAKYPQEHINRLPGKHLDFFYERVLRFARRPPVPDRAHVLVELKKGSPAQAIGPDHEFEGKDQAGGLLTYSPVRETVLSAARIESVRSVFWDRSGAGRVRFAQKADSADGLGAPFTSAYPSWRAFGHPSLPEAQIGFAVASPVLRMKEGSRTVSLSLDVGGIDPAGFPAQALSSSLNIFVTGEKSWLGPYKPEATVAPGKLVLRIGIPAGDPAVVDHNPKLHASTFSAEAPVLQVLMQPGAALGYNQFRKLELTGAQLEVLVDGMQALELESEHGPLDPKKTFLPFGPRPGQGSRFMVRCTEALSKNLVELTLRVDWQGNPSDLATHYANYGVGTSFTATVDFQDAGSWRHSGTYALFQPLENGVRVFEFKSSTTGGTPGAQGLEARNIYALNKSGGAWARASAMRRATVNPVLEPHLRVSPLPARPGYLVFTYNRESLEEVYRQKTVQNLMEFAKGTKSTLIQLKEPYVPAVKGVSLKYRARSDKLNVTGTTVNDFAEPDVRFFLVGCFGQMLEHGYQRRQFAFVEDKRVSLFPRYDAEGQLLLGLQNLEAGRSVSILFQCAEGSADPDLEPHTPSWAVICDNYWRPLRPAEAFGDTTHNMRSSGLLTFVIPKEATSSNTIMPPGLVWIRGSIAHEVDAACRLVAVAANGVEVEMSTPQPSPAVLAKPNPPGTITRMRSVLPLVKSISQPYPTFGGAAPEGAESLRMRAAERLRHKSRTITRWDYERLVLEAFPSVHRVKCIPHAKEGSWLAPGNVLIIVVADLRNRNTSDPLRPRLDAETIDLITEHLRRRTGLGVNLKVRNPSYQRARFDLKVRLHAGYEFNFYSTKLNDELIAFLSPWARDASSEPLFGGRIYKSVVLNFIEDLTYVDYITDFKMFMPDRGTQEVHDARAGAPTEILVSDYGHTIREAT